MIERDPEHRRHTRKQQRRTATWSHEGIPILVRKNLAESPKVKGNSNCIRRNLAESRNAEGIPSFIRRHLTGSRKAKGTALLVRKKSRTTAESRRDSIDKRQRHSYRHSALYDLFGCIQLDSGDSDVAEILEDQGNLVRARHDANPTDTVSQHRIPQRPRHALIITASATYEGIPTVPRQRRKRQSITESRKVFRRERDLRLGFAARGRRPVFASPRPFRR